MKKIFALVLITIILMVSTSHVVLTINAQETGELSVKVTLTVIGTIDTYDDDPDEFLDPMYYIWIDANGNPNDGGYGNGQGTYQTGIQLGAEWVQIDSPRLHFWGPGPDGSVGTSDDENWYLTETAPGSSRTWIGNEVEASISGDGRSLTVTFPLSKIGSPVTLEVSFMAATSTSVSTDNLHPTSPLSQGFEGWIGYPNSIDATLTGVYSKNDAAETLAPDFDISSGSVEIFESISITQEMREPGCIEIVLPLAGIVTAILAVLVSIGPSFNAAVEKIPVPKHIKTFLKIYAASLFQKVDKAKIELLQKAPLLSKSEYASLGISVSLLTIIYAIVEANGFPNFLNPSIFATVVPSTFLSSGIVVTFKVFSDAFWARTFKVYKQLGIWAIGVVMFLISGLVFLFPFSSPGITRYQSDEISKRTKGLLVMFKTFTVLSLLIPFSILFMLGFQVIGDSGLLLTLMSTCYSLVPLKYLAGKALFDYRKGISLVMLFSVGLLFFGCTISVLPQLIYLATGIASATIAFLTYRKLRNRLGASSS